MSLTLAGSPFSEHWNISQTPDSFFYLKNAVEQVFKALGLVNFSTKKQSHNIKFSDLKLIFKNLKTLFDRQGYSINWKEVEKQKLDQTINTLSMASPFSLEEKQILLETIGLDDRKKKLEEIIKTYLYDNYSNNTIQ